MPIKRRDPAKDYLFEAILSLRTVEDCYNFFDDLCTIKEVDDMSKRICVAKMLDENTVYTEENRSEYCHHQPDQPLSQIRQ